MFYENMSGYLRGFGISLTPALITTIRVCGIRFYWVFCVFPHFHTFANIVMVYPISLGTTAFFMVVAVLLLPPGTHLSRHPSQSDSPLNTTLNATPVIN